jgi:ATP adenylyltransferase
VSLDRLWAGWRSSYIDGIATEAPPVGEDGCLFCGLAAGDPTEMMVLGRNEYAFAVMNAYPYNAGHLMVAPLRHVPRLGDLEPHEAAGVMELVRTATLAVEAAYSPDGQNVGMNLGRAAGAGVPDHMHVHVLPRWAGDTNFMTAIAEARVLPESLSVSYEKLRVAWPDPPEGGPTGS